ncbi:MAG: hypothetical protein M1812_001512 [Candelaria pacifica]|nr:MAG: hypothetical protein M1812_001512 [Candelaria pacifica]
MLSKYDFIIQHRPGLTNPADGSSRRSDYEPLAGENPPSKPFLEFAATQVPLALKEDLKAALKTDELAQKLAEEKLSTEQEEWSWKEGIL